MSGCIAVLNAGSSSIKFALYEADAAQGAMFRGQIEQIGVSPRLRVADADGEQVVERSWPADGLRSSGGDRRCCSRRPATCSRAGRSSAVGHRVVHGGTKYAAPIRTDPEVMAALAALAPLAPLHQPHNLGPIETIAELAPQMPQVACFDTAFHRSQPPLAQLFALPRKFTDAGVRRYGFHGLSYEYVDRRAWPSSRPTWRRPGSSSPTSATAPACAPCRRAAASRARWGSPRSTAWSWAPVAARSIPAC